MTPKLTSSLILAVLLALVLVARADPPPRPPTPILDTPWLPFGSSIPLAVHPPDFRTSHGPSAGRPAATCDSCHQSRKFCVGCHAGVLRPLDLHPADYVTLHAIDARRETQRCDSCHRAQTFCTGCHNRSGVGPDPRTSGFASAGPPTGPRFHPPDWSNASGAWADNRHGLEARRNLRQCASCHREETCVPCHSGDTSPHPPGWSSSRRCSALAERNQRVCVRCHLDRVDCR